MQMPPFARAAALLSPPKVSNFSTDLRNLSTYTSYYCLVCSQKTVIQTSKYSENSYNQTLYPGIACDLVCQSCGASFPSPESWQEKINRYDKKRKKMGISFVICEIIALICLAALKLNLSEYVAFLYKWFASFSISFLLVGCVSCMIAFVAAVNYRSEKKKYEEHVGKLNGFGTKTGRNF